MLVAIDTETTATRSRTLLCDGATCIDPDTVPDFVIMSYCTHSTDPISSEAGTHHGDAAHHFLTRALTCDELVFHNVAFDYFVILKKWPDLHDAFNRAIEEGRVHDTMILETLLHIADGRKRRDGKPLTISDSLEKLEKRYGLSIERSKKDQVTSDIRLSFGDYLGREHELPPQHLEYAQQDAVSTLGVYRAQQAQLDLYKPQVPAEMWKRWGPLTERIQIMGAIGLADLSRTGMYVDRPQALTLRDRLEAELALYSTALINYQIAKVTPKTHRFSISQLRLRTLLRDYAAEHAITPEYTASGKLGLRYDFWAREITPWPVGKPLPSSADTPTAVAVWMRYARTQQLLKRYVTVYASADVHYPRYYCIGARTGRTSASKPAIQQVPKRKQGGLREIFIAPPGKVLLEADFTAAELVALAQIFRDRRYESPLADAINAGSDPHIATARRLRPDFDSLDDAGKKSMRQAAKAINFGLPGGLGSAKFAKYSRTAFGIEMTEVEAKALRAKVLDTDPALRAYLTETLHPVSAVRLAAANLMTTESRLFADLDAFHHGGPDYGKPDPLRALRRLRDWSRAPQEARYAPSQVPPGFDPKRDLFRTSVSTRTGRVRGRASYTEARNTPFQGLVADAIKIVLWTLLTDPARPATLTLHTTTHDSVLASAIESEVEASKEFLKRVFVNALSSVCPEIVTSADVTVLGSRWSGT